jgi:hypothetical protein
MSTSFNLEYYKRILLKVKGDALIVNKNRIIESDFNNPVCDRECIFKPTPLFLITLQV